MPAEIALKCAECGAVTGYHEAKFTKKGLLVRHDVGCSQRDVSYPKLYITKP